MAVSAMKAGAVDFLTKPFADVCSVLATSAPTAQEHDLFADLASKWSRLALDRESQLATDLERFDDDGGAQSLEAYR
jgi:FixJ family two-component response regulator